MQGQPESERHRRISLLEIQEKPVFFAQEASSGPQLCFDVCDSQQHLTAYFQLFEIVYIALDTFIRRRKYTCVAEQIHTFHMPFLPHLHTKQIFASPCSRNSFITSGVPLLQFDLFPSCSALSWLLLIKQH